MTDPSMTHPTRPLLGTRSRRDLARVLLFLMLPLAACGGGGTATPDEQPSNSPQFVQVCPCPVPMDVLLGGIVQITPHAYTIRGDLTEYEVYDGAQSQMVDTTLSMPLLVASGTYDGTSALHIVGCRGSGLVWVTFGDLDDDGVVDDKIGEYALPGTMKLSALTYDAASGVALAYEPGTRSIIRFTDSNADLVPDSHAALATHSVSTPIIPAISGIRLEPGGVLVCYLADRVFPMDTVTVITDADYDGSPESVVSIPLVVHRSPRPQFVLPPRADETTAEISGIPGSTIQLWRVDEDGEKVSEDPAVSQLGQTTLLTTSATGTIQLATPLVMDEFVRLFDAVPDTLPGPTTQVVAPYPIVSSISPTSIDGTISNVLTVTGVNFGLGTMVTLTLDAVSRGSVALPPSIQSATQLTVTVPALGAQWVGSAHLRAHDANSPVHEIGHPIIVYR